MHLNWLCRSICTNAACCIHVVSLSLCKCKEMRNEKRMLLLVFTLNWDATFDRMKTILDCFGSLSDNKKKSSLVEITFWNEVVFKMNNKRIWNGMHGVDKKKKVQKAHCETEYELVAAWFCDFFFGCPLRVSSKYIFIERAHGRQIESVPNLLSLNYYMDFGSMLLALFPVSLSPPFGLFDIRPIPFSLFPSLLFETIPWYMFHFLLSYAVRPLRLRRPIALCEVHFYPFCVLFEQKWKCNNNKNSNSTQIMRKKGQRNESELAICSIL